MLIVVFKKGGLMTEAGVDGAVAVTDPETPSAADKALSAIDERDSKEQALLLDTND